MYAYHDETNSGVVGQWSALFSTYSSHMQGWLARIRWPVFTRKPVGRAAPRLDSHQGMREDKTGRCETVESRRGLCHGHIAAEHCCASHNHPDQQAAATSAICMGMMTRGAAMQPGKQSPVSKIRSRLSDKSDCACRRQRAARVIPLWTPDVMDGYDAQSLIYVQRTCGMSGAQVHSIGCPPQTNSVTLQQEMMSVVRRLLEDETGRSKFIRLEISYHIPYRLLLSGRTQRTTV